MIDTRRPLLAAFVLAALCLPAGAQAPAPAASAPANELIPLRSRVPTDADRQAIIRWIDRQIQTASAEPHDLAAFRKAFLGEFRAAGATENYKNTFADLAAEAFAKAIADPNNGQGRGGLLCAMMLSLLSDMKRPSSVPSALAGLSHKMAILRNQAARCIAQVGDKIPAADLPRVVDAVEAAAVKETSGVVLRSLYEALPSKNREDTAKRITQILKARLAAYQNRDLRACAGDAAAAAVLAAPAGLPAETQRLAVQRLAEILTAATLNYLDLAATAAEGGPPHPDAHNLELVIDSVERALTSVTKRGADAPSITAKMKTAGANRLDNMRSELNRWIGTGQAPGILNAAPFGLPAGLPDVKLAPSPATHAAAPSPAVR